MSKLTELRISRRRWARGGMNGDAALLNEDNNMCCLGFACRKEGVPEKDLQGKLLPANLRNARKLVTSLVTGRGYDRAPIDLAAEINDDIGIDESEREEKLKPVLAKLGFKVVFTG